MQLPFISRARHNDELRSLATQLVTTQDQLRWLKERLAAAEAAASAAAADGLAAREMVANWMAQRQFGERIFGSPQLQEEAPHAEILDAYNQRQGRARARDIAQAAAQKFFADRAASEAAAPNA